MNQEVVDFAKEMRVTSPKPQRIRITGRLDMVRVSTNSFALKLDDGQEVRGVLTRGDIREVATLLVSNRRALVIGWVVYRPSGRVLRIDADFVEDGSDEPGVWSHLPEPQGRVLDTIQLRRPQGPRNGIAAVIGRWPGDEDDRTISEALERIS